MKQEMKSRITAVEDLYKVDVFSAGMTFLQCITNFMKKGSKHTLADGTEVGKLPMARSTILNPRRSLAVERSR